MRCDMHLEQMLFSQGFGTRHECLGLIVQGRVVVSGVRITDPYHEITQKEFEFSVDGKNWPYYEKAIIALHKPKGYECSQKPLYHPSVMTLLPPPLRVRGVQPVGRLDEDTTGLLILTDDGALQHRLIHPKKHVQKIYRVTSKHPMTDQMFQQLMKGIILEGERGIVKALKVEKKGERVFEMTLDQGKYHQVKRMVAAVGNRVEALHRVCFGLYQLPTDLKEGQWCFIKREDLI